MGKKRSSRRSRSSSRSRSRSRSRDRKSSKSKSKRKSFERRAEKRKKPSNFDSGALKAALAGGLSNNLGISMAHNPVAIAQYMAMTRTSRRVYVGNLPANIGLTETLLRDFFNSTLVAKGLATELPVVSVAMKPGSAFCFMELRAVQDFATAIVMLQGVTLGVNFLKIAKPSDFSEAPAHLTSFVVPLNMADINANAAASAPSPSTAALAALPVASEEGESKVLLLQGLLTSEDVEMGDEYEDLQRDIEYECNKYAAVEKMVVVLEPEIKVFVAFANRKESCKAVSILKKRAFNGKKLNPIYYDETLYQTETKDL